MVVGMALALAVHGAASVWGRWTSLQSSSSLDETDDQPATETSSQSRWMRVVQDAIRSSLQGCQDEEASRSSARIQAEEN